MSKDDSIFPELGDFVTSSRDFIGKSKKIDQYGIFSECIFGPEQSYKCSCGNLTHKSLNGGKKCPKCGVLCASNELRYSTFGKIKTIFPFIKPNKTKEVFKKIDKKLKVMVDDPTKSDAFAATKRYIAIHNNLDDIKAVTTLTPEKNYTIIPFRITGLYSFYIVLKFCSEYLKIPFVKEIFDQDYFTFILKVLPPNVRPATHDMLKGEVRTPKINTYYTSILGLNTSKKGLMFNLKADEQNWMGLIKTQMVEGIFDQEIVDATLIEYDSIASRYQYYVNMVYLSIYSELSGKTGLIRSSVLGRNIEFSARTVIKCQPNIEPYQIAVSKNILKKLWTPYFLHYLCIVRDIDYDYAYEKFILDEKESNETKQLFNEFLEWMYNDEN